MVGTITDITERKLAEKALQNSERELAIRKAIVRAFLTVPGDEMYPVVLDIILDVFKSGSGIFGYFDENGALVIPSMTRGSSDQCQVPEKSIVFPRETWGDT